MDLTAIVFGGMAATIVALVFILFRTAKAGDAKARAAAVRAKEDTALQAISWFMSQPRRKRRAIMTKINRLNVARNTAEQEQEILERHTDQEGDETPNLEVVKS